MTAMIKLPSVWPHIATKFPSADAFTQACKVAEEAGEVVGAVIKQREDRRTEQDVLDELADTIIAATAALQSRGVDASREVETRWAEVRARPDEHCHRASDMEEDCNHLSIARTSEGDSTNDSQPEPTSPWRGRRGGNPPTKLPSAPERPRSPTICVKRSVWLIGLVVQVTVLLAIAVAGLMEAKWWVFGLATLGVLTLRPFVSYLDRNPVVNEKHASCWTSGTAPWDT